VDVDEAEVRGLFRRAVADDDADALRTGLEALFGGSGADLSPEAEARLRHDDYVMEMPQSGERVRGREAMRAMQEAFPAPPGIVLRRVTGAGRTWVVEAVNDYGGDVWHAVLVLELTDDGRVVRDTRYYAQAFAPPAWRAAWVERM
jgi:hypothetical protein